MIFSGSGCVSVKKIEDLAKKPAMLTHLFCNSEIEYANNFKDKNIHLAGCLAAKIALIKACSFFDKLQINKVEIRHSSSGKPYVFFTDNKPKDFLISLSISHTKSIAVALCVISKNGKILSTRKKKRYS